MNISNWNIKRTKKNGPESVIQEKVKKKLELLGWIVIVLHGNIYQQGMPDLFATHKKYGIKLIEIKNPINYGFTPAQIEMFPKLQANGTQVYVLTSDHDNEISKIFEPIGNWYQYLRIE